MDSITREPEGAVFLVLSKKIRDSEALSTAIVKPLEPLEFISVPNLIVRDSSTVNRGTRKAILPGDTPPECLDSQEQECSQMGGFGAPHPLAA